MNSLLRLVAWVALPTAMAYGGGRLGAALSPHVNAHNDWGATWLLCVSVGALTGFGLAVLLLVAMGRRE